MNKKTLILLFLIPCIVVLFISFTSSAKPMPTKLFSNPKKWTQSQTIGDAF